MKLLIVAATIFEIQPFLEEIRIKSIKSTPNFIVQHLITGVGITSTTYSLTKHLQHNQYDCIIQVGVGGAYDLSLPLGTLVLMNTDQFGDLGAEDNDQYLSIFDLSLFNENQFPFTNRKLLAPHTPIYEKITLPQCAGLTVHTVSGKAETITLRNNNYHCDIESMEGAAFHYVCLMEDVAFAQIRAISNHVIPRNKSTWKMKEAITHLNNWLINFVEELYKENL